MKMQAVGLVATFGILLAAEPVAAHHSALAEFDPDMPVKVTGTLKTVEWQNPHVWFFVDVTEDDGTVTTWGFSTAPPGSLMRRGHHEGRHEDRCRGKRRGRARARRLEPLLDPAPDVRRRHSRSGAAGRRIGGQKCVYGGLVQCCWPSCWAGAPRTHSRRRKYRAWRTANRTLPVSTRHRRQSTGRAHVAT